MRRVFAVIVLLGVAASVWLLPHADGARVAALDCYRLLDRPIEGQQPAQTLGEAILGGPATDHDSKQHATLFLYGVRFVSMNPPTDDITIHDLARRSVIRGLRDVAAKQGLSLDVDGEWNVSLAGQKRGANLMIALDGRTLAMEYDHPDGTRLHVVQDDFAPADRTSLLPPIVAILLAILFRRPIFALLAGIVCAAALLRLATGAGATSAALWAVPDVATKLFWPQLVDPTYLLIVAFTILTLAMVGVMTKSGGVRGIVDAVARRARTARSSQFATWLVGVLVFFDDYVSCILVGSTMRRVTDTYRVSREKLAYLVDSTAAPVASIALFSSWIAFQVSLFAPQLPAARMSTSQGYAVFVDALPYRFYSLFTIFLAAVIALSGRDLGPMLKAERRARTTGRLQRDGARPMTSDDAAQLEPPSSVVPRAHRAIVPMLVFIGATLFELVRVGYSELTRLDPSTKLADLLTSAHGWTELLSKGDNNRAMAVGALAGFLAAALFAFTGGLRGEILRSAWRSLAATFSGVVILYCAWMIAAACEQLGTATYLTELLGDKLAPELLPSLLFLLACFVSFSTGTSWGTMGMLLPLVVGLAFKMGERSLLGPYGLTVAAIAAVMEGAIFGDHCSPLSSTSILSSIGSAADLIDHVRTQLPYGLLALIAALVAGWFPCTFFHWSPWLSLAVGCALLLMVVFVFGRKAEPVAPPPAPAPVPEN